MEISFLADFGAYEIIKAFADDSSSPSGKSLVFFNDQSISVAGPTSSRYKITVTGSVDNESKSGSFDLVV